ncbi:alpha-galactosidase [Agarivorans sp. TSD2052]|uniref:alpha-galactosidase n=1 Tax=Agarivorans sp. TSD2052 TaxID=2937286 RepID=UPI00200F5F31|nr:alpha-galactosidase [Agarivorans sp. TSD2052]UPW19973.1 alpha-galactosidase [Agarivorans sp. TSD2052]
MSIYHLYGQSSSVVMRETSSLPEIIYWGAKLNHPLDDNLLSAISRPVGEASLDEDVALTVCPEASEGWFASPGLEGNRAGKDWCPSFTASCSLSGHSHLTIKAQDTRAQLALQLSVNLDEASDVLTLQTTLSNLGAKRYNLQRLALTLPLSQQCNELLSLHGRWTKEFQQYRQPLERGIIAQENRRGRTSHQYFPGAMIGSQGFNHQQGEVYGFHLAWSGNHRLQSGVKTDGRRWLQAEELLLSGEVGLEQGETYQTPILYASYSANGLNQMSANFHRFVRQHILRFPKTKARPVHLNTWEGIYFDHDPVYIKKMASLAADMGVERFIIDDGWFPGRDHDKAGLGDWYLDTQKYPNGLEEVIDHVLALGMEFGLWFEPEMVNPDSDLFRQHPDWILGQAGYQQKTGRYQYVLDLQHPQVFDYLLARLDSLLSQYTISYIKWDMNRELVQPSHLGEAAVHGQTKAFYALLDELAQRHPDLEIESCSSGGGRIDYEVLKRSQRFWLSDSNDALERQIMQPAMLYFFPPEVMGSHIGPAHSHTTYRQHSIGFRGLTALLGHMGVELDPVAVEEQERQQFAHYIALHKTLRPLLHSGTWQQLPQCDASWQAYGVQDQRTGEGVYWAVQLTMPSYSLPGALKLLNLDPKARYWVEVLDKPDFKHIMKQRPSWINQATDFSGDSLMKLGLQLPIMDPESALLIKVTRQL